MRTKWRHGLLALGAVVAAGSATAAVPDPWGLYVGFDTGRTTFNLHSDQLDDLLGIAGGSSHVDSHDQGYSLVAGFRFTENVAIEAAWLDLGTTRYATASEGNLRIGSRGAMVSGIFTVPLNKTWALEGRVGMYLIDSHPRGYLDIIVEVGTNGKSKVTLEGEGGADPAGMLGAGLVASFDQNWSFHIGYEYFTDKTIDVRVADASQNLDTSGSRLVAGVRYRF
jgi:opacity protein-like surface antigen